MYIVIHLHIYIYIFIYTCIYIYVRIHILVKTFDHEMHNPFISHFESVLHQQVIAILSNFGRSSKTSTYMGPRARKFASDTAPGRKFMYLRPETDRRFHGSISGNFEGVTPVLIGSCQT